MQYEGSVTYMCNVVDIFVKWYICQEHEMQFAKYVYSLPSQMFDANEFMWHIYSPHIPYMVYLCNVSDTFVPGTYITTTCDVNVTVGYVLYTYAWMLDLYVHTE